MKKQVLSWLAIAVMLSAAVALFAYHPTMPVAAKAGDPAVAMPDQFATSAVQILPVNEFNAQGEVMTIGQLNQVFVQLGRPNHAKLLAKQFAAKGWDWSDQAQVKVTAARYKVAGGTMVTAPAEWNWRQVAARSHEWCICCGFYCSGMFGSMDCADCRP